jgi:hypothetical protein
MKLHNGKIGLLRMGLLVLLIASCIGVVSASSRVVSPGEDIAIGEKNLDIMYCVSGNTVGWWAGPVTGAPTKTMVIRNKRSFFADPSQFIGYTGNWYNYNQATGTVGTLAFHVVDSQPGMASRVVSPGANIAIGEKNLDITYCVSGNTVGWWAGPVTGAPTKTMVIRNKRSFSADPSQFIGYTGNWYNYNQATGTVGTLAFNIV